MARLNEMPIRLIEVELGHKSVVRWSEDNRLGKVASRSQSSSDGLDAGAVRTARSRSWDASCVGPCHESFSVVTKRKSWTGRSKGTG